MYTNPRTLRYSVIALILFCVFAFPLRAVDITPPPKTVQALPTPVPTPTPTPVVNPLQKDLDDCTAKLSELQKQAQGIYQQRNQLSVQLLDLQFTLSTLKNENDDFKRRLGIPVDAPAAPTPAPTVVPPLPVPAKSDK